jgi:DNA-nicking Smr family endonuclease
VRSLAPDEAELWARVTATIRPLSRDPVAAEPVEAREIAQSRPPLAKPKGRVPRPRAGRAEPSSSVPPHRHQTLDGSWDRRLKSGAVAPDRVVDLHGMNLDAAWSAIDRALEQAREAGERVLLLITGHERPGDPPIERGRIRAAVHDWLAASRHAGRIAAVRGAHRRHGGGGSLYIILRRR